MNITSFLEDQCRGNIMRKILEVGKKNDVLEKMKGDHSGSSAKIESENDLR